MSKKSKYFWKKILILTWMFSLFLSILAGPCAVDAKNQKEKILIEVIILFMVIPRKINFTQMGS